MKFRTHVQLLCAAACIAPIASPSYAQDRSADEARASDASETAQGPMIVVTATRRAENLQDVPQSIQVVTAEDLKDLGAVNFADYARTVAGLQFQDDGPGRSQIFIRGVSSGADIDTGKESTVGVYIDETPVSEGSSQPDLKLYDIKRVEVLRGPQGTLFGSGSLGGTLRVITNEPDFQDAAAFGEVTGSLTEGGGVNGSGNAWFNLPLGETTALRAVGYVIRNSGFLDNGQTGEKDINDETSYGGRVALRHQPSDIVDVTLTGMYQHSELGSYSRISDRYPALIIDQREPEPFLDRFGVINLKVEVDLGFADLTSSTSYFDRRRAFDNDIDYFLEALAGIPSGRSFLRYDAESVTQEVRVTSQPGAAPFNWLIGGYFVERNEDYFQTININGLPVPSLPEANLFYSTTASKIRQLAAFGELEYELLPGLELTAGVRVSGLNREDDAVNAGLALGGIIDRQLGSFSDTATTPKFNIAYQADPNLLVYAQASKGFRIGGTNPGLPPCPTCLIDIQPQFGPDSLWNYEVGVKAQPFGRALTFNAALFWIDWNNIQLSVSRADGFAGFANAGRARSRGFEIEANAQLAPGLQAGGQVTYTDAELRSLDPGVQNFATVGVQLPQVPKWAASGFGEWGADIGNGRLTLRGDVQYQGPRQNMLGPTAARLNDYLLANARVTYAQSEWSLSAFVTNLTDVRAQLARDILSGVRDGNPIVLDRYTINAPRTWGLTFGYNF